MRAVFRRTLVSTALVFGSLVAGSPLALAQDKPKAEVMHWWTSGGESAAVKVFAEQYSKAGGEWVDTAIANGTNARAAAINRIVGGNPPTASQFNTGKQFDDLVAQGLLEQSRRRRRRGQMEELPAAGLRRCDHPRRPYLCRAGQCPRPELDVLVEGRARQGRRRRAADRPGTRFFATLDKVKAAGLIPIALGGQPWQERSLFNSVLLSTDKDLYMKVYGDKSEEAIKSPAFKAVVETYGKMRDYVDPGSPGPQLERCHRAADHRQGRRPVHGRLDEGRVQGRRAAARQGLSLRHRAERTQTSMIGGDVFVFPKTTDAGQIKAQQLLAATMLSPRDAGRSSTRRRARCRCGRMSIPPRSTAARRRA